MSLFDSIFGKTDEEQNEVVEENFMAVYGNKRKWFKKY